jgi:Flp pilus assembly pilin Flp
MNIKHTVTRSLSRTFDAIRHDERGVTTLEYVIAAAIVLVVLSAAILAWNNGLAAKIGELVRTLAGT